MASFYKLTAVVLLVLLTSSCSHYQLGTSSPSGEKLRVWVDPILVEEAISGVAIPLNRELREAIIRSRLHDLPSQRESADQILKVVLKKQERVSLARRTEDTGLSDVLGLTFVCQYELIRRDAEVLRSGELEVSGQIFRQAGFIESSRQTTPILLRELADDILHASVLNW